MVLQKASSIKKLRKWQTGYVWLIWRFRGFVEEENKARKAKNEGMRKHWSGKRAHIWNKILEHEKSVPKELQLEQFTKTVMVMVNKGVPPKQILGELGISKKPKR